MQKEYSEILQSHILFKKPLFLIEFSGGAEMEFSIRRRFINAIIDYCVNPYTILRNIVLTNTLIHRIDNKDITYKTDKYIKDNLVIMNEDEYNNVVGKHEQECVYIRSIVPSSISRYWSKFTNMRPLQKNKYKIKKEVFDDNVETNPLGIIYYLV